MARRPVTRRERLTGYDKRGGVRTEILEEIRKAVEENEGLGCCGRRNEPIVAETHAAEQDGKHGKAHELDGLAAPAVDDEEGRPVSGNETGDREDEVTEADILEVDVHRHCALESLWRVTKADGVEDDGGVETETVERDLS